MVKNKSVLGGRPSQLLLYGSGRFYALAFLRYQVIAATQLRNQVITVLAGLKQR